MTPKRTTLYYTKRKQTEMKKNILNKKKAFEILDLSSISKAFFLAGAGGLEPATHGFGVASKYRKALKLLAFLHVSRHFSSKTTCRNCVWKYLMLFWWYDKISDYILAANVLFMLLKIWGAINKEELLRFCQSIFKQSLRQIIYLQDLCIFLDISNFVGLKTDKNGKIGNLVADGACFLLLSI